MLTQHARPHPPLPPPNQLDGGGGVWTVCQCVIDVIDASSIAMPPTLRLLKKHPTDPSLFFSSSLSVIEGSVLSSVKTNFSPKHPPFGGGKAEFVSSDDKTELSMTPPRETLEDHNTVVGLTPHHQPRLTV